MHAWSSVACEEVNQYMSSDVSEFYHDEHGVEMDVKNLWAALDRQHCEILQCLDKHFAQQQQLVTQVFGTTRAHSMSPKSTGSVHAKVADRDQGIDRQDRVEEPALQNPRQTTGVIQLPGSTELLPVVPVQFESLPMPGSSAVEGQWVSTGGGSKSQREHIQTLRRKIQQRVAQQRRDMSITPLHKSSFLATQFQHTTDRRLLRLLHSGWFDACTFFLILSFSVYIVVPLIYEDGCSSTREGHFAVDVVFCVLFAVELTIRVAPYGLRAFRSHDWFWNIVDAVIVCFSFIDIILRLSSINSSMVNPMTFRILRVTRAVSTLRIVRMFTMFRELRLLVHSVVGCVRSLGFSLVMLFAFIVLCGTLLTMGAQSCLHDVGQLQAAEISKEFGTLGRSCITLFMAICGGIDWGEAYWLLGALGWQYQLIYICYVSFTVFGLVNVFTGVFVDHAMQASRKDRENQIRNQIQEEDHNLRELQRVFVELDLNMSGKLSLEEFESHLNDERALAYFQAVKLDVTDIGRLFHLLDADGSGGVDIEEFIEGCQRLKGESRSLDIKIALIELEQMRDELHKFAANTAQQLAQLNTRVFSHKEAK